MIAAQYETWLQERRDAEAARIAEIKRKKEEKMAAFTATILEAFPGTDFTESTMDLDSDGDPVGPGLGFEVSGTRFLFVYRTSAVAMRDSSHKPTPPFAVKFAAAIYGYREGRFHHLDFLSVPREPGSFYLEETQVRPDCLRDEGNTRILNQAIHKHLTASTEEKVA